jgi:hypothetical protein
VRGHNNQADPLTRKRVSMAKIRRVAIDEADRIRGVQAALVAEGLIREPHSDQLARAAAFDAMARLIDIVADDKAIFDQIIERAKRYA